MKNSNSCLCFKPDLRNIPGGFSCLSCGQTTLDNLPENGGVDANKPIPPLFCSDVLNARYSYKPLQAALSIRLVRLHAGRGKEDLHCEVFHSNLDDHQDFEALSYTWGASIVSRKIYSNDGLLDITESCAAALQDLRYSFRDRVLWIDAICINQNDNKEKSKQVPLMNKIYAEARRVVIYIGPESRPNINLFFDYFRREEAGTKNRVLQPAASAFLSKPWFSRVWILQEVAVAREALLMWGSEALDWRHFSAARFNALKLMPVDKSGKTPPVLQLAQDERKPLRDFASLMHTARGCLATDPRDKVYALLGLLGGHVRHPLIIDYSKSVEDLYIEVAMHIINSYNHLDVLSAVGNETEQETETVKACRLRGAIFEARIQKAVFFLPDAKKKYMEAREKAAELLAVASRLEEEERKAWREFEDLEERERTNSDRESRREDELFPDSSGGSIKPGHSAFSIFSNFFSPKTLPALTSSITSVKELEALWQNARAALEQVRQDPLIEDYNSARRDYEILRMDQSLSPDGLMSLISRELHSGMRFYEECQHGLQLPSWVPDLRKLPSFASFSYFRPESRISKPQQPVAQLYTNPEPQGLPMLCIKILKLDIVAENWENLNYKNYSDREPPKKQNEDFLRNFQHVFHMTNHGSSFASLQNFSLGRRRFPTLRSWVICTGQAKSTDVICAVYGASVPFLLRPTSQDAQHFRLMGECYLQGFRGPKFVDDYLELLGDYKQYFDAVTTEDLPWEKAYLE